MPKRLYQVTRTQKHYITVAASNIGEASDIANDTPIENWDGSDEDWDIRKPMRMQAAMSKDDLRGWLAQKSMSQSKFAIYLGVSVRTVNRWVNGKAVIPVWVGKICELNQ